MHCRSQGGTNRLQRYSTGVFEAGSFQMLIKCTETQDTYGKITGMTLGWGRDHIPSLDGLL